MGVRGVRVVLLCAVALLVLALAGCGLGGAQPAPTPDPRITVGVQGTIGDVAYIAVEQVGTDRLARERLEAAGEARIEALARRQPAYRLKNNSKAALRYTQHGPRAWLAWQPLAVLYARRDLARRENTPPGNILTVDVTHETWPDSCLGAAEPGQSCAQAQVPGFRVLLKLGNRTHEYHTDLEERVVLAPP